MKDSAFKMNFSAIQGRGLFTTKLIREGDVAFTAEGPVVTYAKPMSSRLGPNWINVGQDQWMIPSPKSLFRYINHSCQPNTILSHEQQFVALTTITPGMEMTMDYSFTESHTGWHMTCECGSNNCRGKIRSIQFLPEAIFRKYQKFVPEFLQQAFLKNKVEIKSQESTEIVIAKRPLYKGEQIYKVEGSHIHYKQPPNYWLGYNWLATGPNTWIIPEEGNPWNFMRHSCAPNVGLSNANEVVALRAIDAQEELSIDNSITEADARWKMTCKCGTSQCRRTIRSIQFLPEDFYRKYLPFIPTFLQEIYSSDVRTNDG